MNVTSRPIQKVVCNHWIKMRPVGSLLVEKVTVPADSFKTHRIAIDFADQKPIRFNVRIAETTPPPFLGSGRDNCRVTA